MMLKGTLLFYELKIVCYYFIYLADVAVAAAIAITVAAAVVAVISLLRGKKTLFCYYVSQIIIILF